MKARFLEYTSAWLLLMILALIVVHAPLTVYVGTQWPDVAQLVKAWKEVLLVLALVTVVADVTRRKQWHLFTQDAFCWLAAAYGAVHIAALAWSDGGAQAVLAGLMIDVRYVLYAVLVYMFVRLYPQYIQSFVRVAVFGAVIVLGFALLQTVLPPDVLKHLGYSESTIAPYLTVDKNPDYVRFNSTLRGPNPLGAYAVIALGVLAAVAVRRWNAVTQWSSKYKVLYEVLAVGAVVALWFSYSRSALLAGVLAVALVLAVRYGRSLTRRTWYTLAVGTLVLAALGWAIRDTSFVHNVVLHDNPTTGAAIDSNEGHLSSLQDGLARAANEPMGMGIGSTGSASLLGTEPLIIENQYLMIAHEVGWLGLALFAVLYMYILWRLWQNRRDWFALGLWASGVGLAVIGLLLPVWADDTVGIVWWGLAAIALYYTQQPIDESVWS